MLKMTSQILFVSGVFVFSSISQAGLRDWIYEPSYEIQKEYIQPISDKDQLCSAKCEIELLNCNATNEARASSCSDGSDFAAGLGNTQTSSDVMSVAIGAAILAVAALTLEDCFGIEDCLSGYESCFTECGGTIKEEEVCISNCEIDEVLKSFKKIGTEEKLVISHIKKYLEGQSGVHIAPDISPNKIDGFLKKTGDILKKEDIPLALIDNTIFGGASEGFSIFKDYFIYKKSFSDPVKIYYSSIRNEVVQKLKETKKGKKLEPYLLVNNHEMFVFSEIAYRFSQFLNHMRAIKTSPNQAVSDSEIINPWD
ncbi:hypothetical protein [Allochromatium palmeri]|uniref:Uncharacterized protein n=1 Tax=Allochromatium palmeri TaxID=231048 RepID=A0A6N8EED9_9GAMM|nr:hypothetical protein [Allochromatium palmeri]MTW22632.1 hypothetical protein [Allochromatium palmeri]